jgi:hypothetical protein
LAVVADYDDLCYVDFFVEVVGYPKQAFLGILATIWAVLVWFVDFYLH